MHPKNHPSDADCLSFVKEIVAGLFAVDVDDIRLTTHFLNDIGMDSLDMIELMMAFECVFGHAIADDDAVDLLTVGDVCAYLKKLKIPETALDEVSDQ